MRNYLEELGKSKGITPNELYSGKYGDQYDEIMTNILNDKVSEKWKKRQ